MILTEITQEKQTETIIDPIEKLHEEARLFLHSNGFIFEDEFYETHDKEVINFELDHPDSTKEKIKCWLRCCYPQKNDGTLGFCITFGAHNPILPAHISKTFWSDSTFILTEEDRKTINDRLAKGRRLASERELEEKKVDDATADWCMEKLRKASITGTSPYFERKGIKYKGGIYFEIRKYHLDGGTTQEETIVLIPLRNIKGKIRGIQEIYPSKRPFKDGEKPRDKNTIGPYAGCFFTFGNIENGKPIHVSEGYGTAEAVYQSKGITTVMTVTSTNISKVCKELHKRYPLSEITICADNDIDTEKRTGKNPGKNCAEEAAKELKCNCKVVFPKFPEGKDIDETGKHYTDFNDLMNVCGNEEVKKQISENAYIPVALVLEKQKKRKETLKIPQNNLSTIQIIPGQLHIITSKAEYILNTSNVGIFQRSGKLVRIITEISKPKKNKLIGKDGVEVIKRSPDSLLIAEVDPIYLTELLGKNANWTRFDERVGDWVIRDCPERIAKHLIARGEWNLPILAGIIQAPTLRPDGSILDQPGYDEITGLFFNAGNTIFPQIPPNPTKEDALQALNTLRKPLKDFPFENKESESVAISGILTGIIRKSIRTAPMHGFTAPIMGSGKSLLADVVSLIATGKNNSVIPQAENEAEEKKRLLAVLSEGDAIICYDNIERPFGSAALCSVLTQEDYKDRLLGVSRSLSVPTNATFLATGNNLTFVGDTSTRAILCRLDPKCERPEERNFDTDLKKYILENRGELVTAGLTILRAYHETGRPKQEIPQFGRFEDWSDWVRSSLVWLGMADPCTSRKEIENADPTRKLLGHLLLTWHEYLGEISFTLKQAIKKAKFETREDMKLKAEELLDALLENFSDGNGDINTRSLGKKLATFINRIENGYRLEKTGSYQGVDTWRVTKIKSF